MLSLSELRQEIMRINNQVNTEHYGYGVKSQKVYFVNDEIILIMAHNKRITALEVLDKQGHSTAEVHHVLLSNFKKRLVALLEQELGIKVSFISKDYDSPTETATTVIRLQEPISTFAV